MIVAVAVNREVAVTVTITEETAVFEMTLVVVSVVVIVVIGLGILRQLHAEEIALLAKLATQLGRPEDDGAGVVETADDCLVVIVLKVVDEVLVEELVVDAGLEDDEDEVLVGF